MIVADPRRARSPERARQIANALSSGGRIDIAEAKNGDPVSSDDGQVKYRAEVHKSGGVTMHRATPKLSKAERKALKRARRR